MAFKITTIQAWLATDENGEEGVCGFRTPSGEWLPMIMGDEVRFKQLRPFAERIAKQTGQKLTLAQFSIRTDLETIE